MQSWVAFGRMRANKWSLTRTLLQSKSEHIITCSKQKVFFAFRAISFNWVHLVSSHFRHLKNSRQLHQQSSISLRVKARAPNSMRMHGLFWEIDKHIILLWHILAYFSNTLHIWRILYQYSEEHMIRMLLTLRFDMFLELIWHRTINIMSILGPMSLFM